MKLEVVNSRVITVCIQSLVLPKTLRKRLQDMKFLCANCMRFLEKRITLITKRSGILYLK